MSFQGNVNSTQQQLGGLSYRDGTNNNIENRDSERYNFMMRRQLRMQQEALRRLQVQQAQAQQAQAQQAQAQLQVQQSQVQAQKNLMMYIFVFIALAVVAYVVLKKNNF